jgi:hypothetical protein
VQVLAERVSDRDLETTQKELIRLLKLSPTLTTVVAHDPTLLSNQDYVARNNPQLAAFLVAHPEVARNPEFYLFTHVHGDDGSPDEALEPRPSSRSWRSSPSPAFLARSSGLSANSLKTAAGAESSSCRAKSTAA